MLVETFEQGLEYIIKQEATDISYCKLGNTNKNLIIAFTSAYKPYFERKQTLLKLKDTRKDFDILYMRNQEGWYLGEMKGIGSDINDTIYFLQNKIKEYDRVMCVGSSMGGYGSILFGSICYVDYVLTVWPQTDLEYVDVPENVRLNKNFAKYKNLKHHLNQVTKYDITCSEKKHPLHGPHHCENLFGHVNVNIEITLEKINLINSIKEFLNK
tara:strand:- start:170 stop:808 length:639 start_codon:yes stop_codon:yes gene_type:complete